MVIVSFREGENSGSYHLRSLYNRTISIQVPKKGTFAIEVSLSGSLKCRFLKQQLGTLTWKVRILRKWRLQWMPWFSFVQRWQDLDRLRVYHLSLCIFKCIDKSREYSSVAKCSPSMWAPRNVWASFPSWSPDPMPRRLRVNPELMPAVSSPQDGRGQDQCGEVMLSPPQAHPFSPLTLRVLSVSRTSCRGNLGTTVKILFQVMNTNMILKAIEIEFWCLYWNTSILCFIEH